MRLQTWIYIILFTAFFPAIWMSAAYLDRVWPTTTELLKERNQEDIPD